MKKRRFVDATIIAHRLAMDFQNSPISFLFRLTISLTLFSFEVVTGKSSLRRANVIDVFLWSPFQPSSEERPKSPGCCRRRMKFSAIDKHLHDNDSCWRLYRQDDPITTMLFSRVRVIRKWSRVPGQCRRCRGLDQQATNTQRPVWTHNNIYIHVVPGKVFTQWNLPSFRRLRMTLPRWR